METLDYKKLGLKCGIEIHQQLEGKKLFCGCPTLLREDKPDFTIKRYLRAVAGELGTLDIAAIEEAAKKRHYLYEFYKTTNCLIEIDEQPPNEINPEALETALLVGKLLNIDFVDRIEVMRKCIIDGSNTSGFQRTALIGANGYIKLNEGKKIGIATLILEEDSARIIEEKPEYVVFRLDRLGIPLLEISTVPEISSPEECKQAAEKIGMILRSTAKVKRGIGTIRQDINVSIAGGNRVEIKGVQELNLIPKIVELEALRQLKLLEIKKALEERGVKEVKSKIYDLSLVLSSTDSKIIRSVLGAGGVVLAIKLEGFASLLGKEVQPGRRFGTELADRAKVLAGVGGIIHSDELPAYGISKEEVDLIKRELGCGEQDAFVLVVDKKEKAVKALNEVLIRAHEALVGVPNEVRKPLPDGTTCYERRMPGAARMYPETDIPSIVISKDLIAKIKTPELIEKKIDRYIKIGLSKDLAELLVRSDKSSIFDAFVKKFKRIAPSYMAEILATSREAIKSIYGIDIFPTNEDFETIFENLDKGVISKEVVLEILKEQKPVREIVSKYRQISEEEAKKILEAIVASNPKAPPQALMGMAMKELRGKISGEKVAKMLDELLKKYS